MILVIGRRRVRLSGETGASRIGIKIVEDVFQTSDSGQGSSAIALLLLANRSARMNEITIVLRKPGLRCRVFVDQSELESDFDILMQPHFSGLLSGRHLKTF